MVADIRYGTASSKHEVVEKQAVERYSRGIMPLMYWKEHICLSRESCAICHRHDFTVFVLEQARLLEDSIPTIRINPDTIENTCQETIEANWDLIGRYWSVAHQMTLVPDTVTLVL